MNDITKQETLDFLRSVSVMNIATCFESKPMSSVLMFYVNDDFEFIVATHRNSFKSKALLANNKISFNVWEHKKMLVQADGFVEEVKDEDEVNKCLDNLTMSVSNMDDFWPPVLRITGDEYIVFKINVTWLRVLSLSDVTINSKGDHFVQII